METPNDIAAALATRAAQCTETEYSVVSAGVTDAWGHSICTGCGSLAFHHEY